MPDSRRKPDAAAKVKTHEADSGMTPPRPIPSSGMSNGPDVFDSGMSGKEVFDSGMSVDWSHPSPIPLTGLLSPETGKRFPLLLGATFPIGAWDPTLRAQVILAEFGALGWHSSITLDGPPTDLKTRAAEIAQLLDYADKTRPSRLSEIIAQANDFTPYFSDLLMIGPISHPATWVLVAVGIQVGQLVAMHFKYKYSRARPVQLYPALTPAILTPSHPSYPNAHALQSRLIAECITLACDGLREPLVALADRIGLNREVAGVHFPSDREASLKLVPQILAQLRCCKRFEEVLDVARNEWAGVKAVPFPDAAK